MSMELRMLVAIVLSFLIFFLYQVFFVKKAPQPVPGEQTVEQKQAKESQPAVVDEDLKPIEKAPVPLEVTVPERSREGRTITVSTPLYVAELTENGGALKGFKLKAYRESLAAGAPMKELVGSVDKSESTLRVSFMGQAVPGLRDAVFDADIEGGSMNVVDTSGRLVFAWRSPAGVTVRKVYTFLPDTYEIGLEIKLENRSPASINDNLTVSLVNNLPEGSSSRYVFCGPAAFVDGKLHEIKTKDVKTEGKQTGRIAWVAYEERYFVSAIVPSKVERAAMNVEVKPSGVVETTYIDSGGPLPPQTERAYPYRVYFGPKSLESLGMVGADLAKIVDFGFFDVIAKPFLHVMNFLYRFIPNYGIVIILITILVKLLFWPLSNKSYQSMSQMKKLQPKMAELRAKYKHDKKMMNQEIMNLYRLYKINPLGGCLPMIFQIPVFFAFYKMLYQAIELRHAPFFLWINDLSAPDRLFSFNLKIPMMTPPYGIPVLTIIMGASMFLQQKMSPPPGDPTQAKMMMFMPIFFTFIFINFPSGLVLYWLVNNILSIVQQHYVTKKTG
jgi:YidC/Oxa1 family membrane protein insertase